MEDEQDLDEGSVKKLSITEYSNGWFGFDTTAIVCLCNACFIDDGRLGSPAVYKRTHPKGECQRSMYLYAQFKYFIY
jgi:hypothetical protein